MKKKRTIIGVFLTLMLLGSLVAAVAPVSAGTLSWTDVTTPSETDNILAPTTDISDIAVSGDGETVWVADSQGNDIYKSTDSGETWVEKSNPTGAISPQLVAIAPDDDDIVVMVADDDEVYISTNGGSTWGELVTGTEIDIINDIAISPESGGSNYIAIAVEDTGVRAKVFSWEYGDASPSWSPIWEDGDSELEAATANSTAAALAFSPNFAGDQVLLVVTEQDDGDTGTDKVMLEIYSYNQNLWNVEVFDGYPATIVSDVGITDLTSGSITLDPEYLGSDDAMRLAFVGLTIDGGTTAIEASGIYRMDDDSDKELKDEVEIHSVAYDGTNLVAGRYDSNVVYRSDDPTGSSPTVSSASSLKRPGLSTSVDEMTLVAWIGSDVVAGTSGDESAFAISRDNGKAFNDISLIDTYISDMNDFAISADGEVTFMATDDGSDLSIWRSASDWERVLTLDSKTDFIIRLAPDDPDVIYIAEKGSKTIYYSSSGGMERWQTRAGKYDTQDMAVETDGDVVYIIESDNGEVSKSTNSGFTWGNDKSTGLGNGFSLRSLGEDLLIAGSDDGHVAYSSDGNSSWDDISKVLRSADNVSVTASGLDDGDYIYAGTYNGSSSTSYIERWEIGDSTSWKELIDLYADKALYEHNVTGIDLVDGVLYAVSSNESKSALIRSISPTFGFDVVEVDADFSTAPQGLTVGPGSIKIYAIDRDDPDVMVFTDTLASAVPTLISPDADFTVPINPITGRAVMLTFIWESPSDDVDDFQIEVAFDDGFDEVVLSETVGEDGDEGDVISLVVGPFRSEPFDLDWNFDTTYHWRIRVKSGEPFKSGWSESRRFSIAEAMVQPPVQVNIPPAPPAPNITVTPPDVIVNIPPVVTVPPAPAPITPAWIWVIVIIGGVLVIALIVLIVRTRRAV